VYDIIPLAYPDLAFPGTPQAFDGWLRSLRRQADRVICISRSVADELRLWWCAHTEEGSLPEISFFHLGADLESNTSLSKESTHLVDLKINPEDAVLMVGTLEPRKGYQLAVEAFETHWAQGGDTSLIIAGKQGWEVNALCERIKTHPQFGRHLFWFDALNDADLQDLYRRCKGLLMASQAEGFGLPLMEAAQHDLPILARDIPVFRELCGVHASYFSTQDDPALAGALQTWLNDIALGVVPRSSGIERLSWQVSAQKLLEEVL
jgi:glycosyltransferase involved in cell wall biosynthesis